MQFIVPLIVVIATLIAGLAIFMLLGVDPQIAFKAYFIEPLSSVYGISEWLLKALPLCLIGLGLAVAYRAQVWNIGAEGQLVMGGIFATAVMVYAQNSITSGALVVLMILAGIVGGMVSANLEMGLAYGFFIDALPRVVPLSNLWIGIGKGFVFGALIALIACHFGLKVRPNTESLSARTTTSVVTAITLVIIVDAIFAILTRSIGIPGVR